MKLKPRLNLKALVTVRGRYALMPERVFRGLVEIGSSLAFAEDKGPKRGLEIDSFMQNYMIAKKLTFNLLLKSTNKKFPN